MARYKNYLCEGYPLIDGDYWIGDKHYNMHGVLIGINKDGKEVFPSEEEIKKETSGETR